MTEETIYEVTPKGAIVIAIGGVTKMNDANNAERALIDFMQKNNCGIAVEQGRLVWRRLKEVKVDTQN